MKLYLILLFIYLVSFSYGQQKATTNDTSDIVKSSSHFMNLETMFKGVAYVEGKDREISKITKFIIHGKETSKAEGHVVAPHFIEGYQHATDSFRGKVNLSDGLATTLDFEVGAGDIA